MSRGKDAAPAAPDPPAPRREDSASPADNHLRVNYLGPAARGRRAVAGAIAEDVRRVVLRFEADEECVLRVYDVASNSCVGALVAHGPPVCAIAFAVDHSLIVTGAENAVIRVWDLSSIPKPAPCPSRPTVPPGKDTSPPLVDYKKLPVVPQLCALSHHQGVILSLVFNPRTSSQFMSTSEDNTAILFAKHQVQNQFVPVLVFKGHSAPVVASLFHPTKSNHFVTASLDMTVRVWKMLPDKDHAAITHVLVGFKAAVFSLDFSPDGSKLVTAALDRSVWIWNVPLEANRHASYVMSLEVAHSARNLLVQWSRLAGDFILVASNNEVALYPASAIWSEPLPSPPISRQDAQDMAAPTLPLSPLVTLLAPKDVCSNGILRAACFNGTSISLLYSPKRYLAKPGVGPTNSSLGAVASATSASDSGCVLVDHWSVAPLLQFRVDYALAVSALFSRYAHVRDVPTWDDSSLVCKVLRFLLT